MYLLTSLKDDTHMTSIKIVQFSRPPTLLFIYVQNSSSPLIVEVQFQTNPSSPLQVVTNQLKANIIQEWPLYVTSSFPQVGFRFQCQFINLVWLSFSLPGFPFYFFSPCMWINEIKTKAKPNHVIFKVTTHSIVRYSPQRMQWRH